MPVFFKPTMLIFPASVILATLVGCHTRANEIRLVSQVPLTKTTLVTQGATYTNPVIDQNFPDPSLLKTGQTFYAYSTNSGENMPCERSSDLVHWTPLPDAMPRIPDWANPGRTWAPEVSDFPASHRFVAYFAAWDRATNEEAIGAAVSATPEGPFTSMPDAKALVEQAALGGAIDPSCFVDADGSRYLVWKNDGNSRGQDTWLWIQKLSPDGLRLIGPETQLIKQDQPWEGQLVEAPTLWKHGGKYDLFYSANFFGDCHYAMGYAISNSLRGPYVKPRHTPWVHSTSDVCGPGGEDIVLANDGTPWMAYHSWAKGPGSDRSMSIDPLTWNGDVPILNGPTMTSEPAPK
jgi:beta-xylosidase